MSQAIYHFVNCVCQVAKGYVKNAKVLIHNNFIISGLRKHRILYKFVPIVVKIINTVQIGIAIFGTNVYNLNKASKLFK